MPEYRIPFNRPSIVGNELVYVNQALAKGHISGDGVFTKRCQAFLEEELGVPQALLTTSCTHALEMAALLLDIQPGDEVILPAFTFVSTVKALALRGEFHSTRLIWRPRIGLVALVRRFTPTLLPYW